jgi:hypothetical protein
MARHPRFLLRNGAGGEGKRQPTAVGVAVLDPTTGNDNDDLIEDELDVKNDDDVREDATTLFGMDLDDDSLLIDVDVVDCDGDRDWHWLDQHSWYLTCW